MSKFTSCIYSGLITHRRFKPKKHFFIYKIFSLFIDLSEVEEIEKTYQWVEDNEEFIEKQMRLGL